MIEVVGIFRKANERKLASLTVKYHDLMIKCDLCLFNEEKLWVRMPEVWMKKQQKQQFVFWPGKDLSDEFQKEVIKQVMEKTGLTMSKAIEIKRGIMAESKAKAVPNLMPKDIPNPIPAITPKPEKITPPQPPFRTADFKKKVDINKK